MIPYRPAPPERLRLECLSVRAPDEEVGAAIEEAKVAIDAYVVAAARERPGAGAPLEAAGDEPARAARIGLAALALGMHDAARALLAVLADGVRAAPRDDARRLYLLLVARYLAWTGDGPLVAAVHWPLAREAWASLRPATDAPAGDVAPGLPSRAALAAELLPAAEAVGDAALATSLRALPTGRGEAAPPPGEPAAWPDAASAGPESARAASRAAARVLAFVHGLLGAGPDAPRHRLLLRPRIPAGWRSLRVEGIRFGDASISLAYEGDGDRYLFRLDQPDGAVPVRVVFEPALPIVALESAAVDGQAARLDARRVGERVVVPVQIVLDHERRIELRGRPADPPERAGHERSRPPAGSEIPPVE